jgi:hypothetical protein
MENVKKDARHQITDNRKTGLWSDVWRLSS